MLNSVFSFLAVKNKIYRKTFPMAVQAVVTVMLIASVIAGCTVTDLLETTPPETSPIETTVPPETTLPTEPTAPPETTAPTTPPETTAPPSPDGTKENPYPAGTYVVGTDIAAGTYVFLPNEEDVPGSFESGDVKQDFYGQFFWDLRSGSTVTVSECCFFTADDYTAKPNLDGSYGPGMYRVGIDIPEGGYTIVPKGSGTPPAVWYRFFSISEPPYHNDYYRSESHGRESLYLDTEMSWGAILLENCKMLLVDEYVFTPPEPPVAQEVKALPEHFGASTLVTPYYQQGVDLIGGGTYYISLPTIYPFSDAAVACQQEIYNAILPTLEYYAEESSWIEMRDTELIPYENIHTARYVAGIGFDAYLYENILSIVVWDKNTYDGITYHVFCLDISTGAHLSNADMISRLGIDQEGILQTMEYTYNKHWGSAKGNKYHNEMYYRELNNTISDQNVAKSQVYIQSDGVIMIAAKIYSLAGAGQNCHLIPYKLTPPASLEDYQALFDASTEDGYMRQMALTSFYSYPSQMDLSLFFHNDFSKNPLTAEENTFLASKNFIANFGVQSHSRSEMDAILQKIFNMPLAHSNRKGLENLVYFSETDSYYSNHDSNISYFPNITITRFEDVGGGIVKLYYTCAEGIHPEYDGKELVVTITVSDYGLVHLFSNQPPQ